MVWLCAMQDNISVRIRSSLDSKQTTPIPQGLLSGKANPAAKFSLIWLKTPSLIQVLDSQLTTF